jgi:hypothetical protein
MARLLGDRTTRLRHQRCRLLGDGLFRWLGSACCGADQDLDLENFSVLGLKNAGDHVEVSIVDPGFQKRRRYGEPHDTLGDRMKLQPGKPACVDIRTDLRLQACANALEKYAILHVSLFPRRFWANRAKRQRCPVTVVQNIHRH